MKRWEYLNRISGKEESLQKQALRMFAERILESAKELETSKLKDYIDYESLYNSIIEYLEEEQEEKKSTVIKLNKKEEKPI